MKDLYVQLYNEHERRSLESIEVGLTHDQIYEREDAVDYQQNRPTNQRSSFGGRMLGHISNITIDDLE